MIEALEHTVDREQWRLFCDAWWEIGVSYTLTHSGDWMLRVLAARMGADSTERQKVDQVLDKIGDFHRRLWDIETEVVRKAVDIAAGGGRVLIVDERLAVTHFLRDDLPIINVLWGGAASAQYYARRSVLDEDSFTPWSNRRVRRSSREGLQRRSPSCVFPCRCPETPKRKPMSKKDDDGIARCAHVSCTDRAVFQIFDFNERRPDVTGTLSCEQHVGFLLGSVPPVKPEGPWLVHEYSEPPTLP